MTDLLNIADDFQEAKSSMFNRSPDRIYIMVSNVMDFMLACRPMCNLFSQYHNI